MAYFKNIHSLAELKKEYRRLALENHPDKGGSTEVMREYLEYEDNFKHCLGVVGSGNKNFNYQYCLTAKQYSEAFKFPFLADYELRGTAADCERVYHILKENSLN